MATYDMKIGKLHVEKSEKENALNLGIESKWGSGFVSVPFGKQELLHAASCVGAALALRGLMQKRHGVAHAQTDARRRQRQVQNGFGSRGGFGGGKRGRKRG